MRDARRLTALLALSLLVPAAGFAQIPIRFGQSVTGKLTTSDQQFSDGSRYKMYAFAGNRGDTVSVELTSEDFDANVVLADGSGNRLSMNDDSGENCNARLTYVLPNAANYRVYANSSAPAELGAYQLRLTRGSLRPVADTVCRGFGRVAGLIQVGQTVTGTLTTSDPQIPGDSTYFQRWILPVSVNQSFTVDLESDDFDAYLILSRGRGDKLVENDDGGGGCNARLVYSAPDDRPLRVIVNTASRPRGQKGRYTLRVTEGEAPTEAKGNCRFEGAGGGAAAGGAVVQPASRTEPQRAAAPQGGIPMVRMGESVTGSLTSRDSLYPDNTYYKFYQFTPGADQVVTIDLSSDEFDPVLIVRGDDLDESIINDDGGPGCSARVSQAFPSRGPYRILVNTTSNPERQTGRFTLSITEGRKPVQETGTGNDCRPPQERDPARDREMASRSIAIGQTRAGRLTTSDVVMRSDSTYVQAWTIRGTQGTTVTIDLESDDFDAYVFLRGSEGSGPRDFRVEDDDSGGNCHARLTATFPETGEYDIVVNTAGAKYATGAFTLSVTSGSKPKSVQRCSRG